MCRSGVGEADSEPTPKGHALAQDADDGRASRRTRTIRVMRSARVLALSLALGACGAPDRSSLTPFGGGWYFHPRSHLPEAGWVPTDLYRDWKGRPVLVARNIEQQQFYAPDCVIF